MGRERRYFSRDIRERDDYARIGKLDIWYQEKMCIAVADESKTFRGRGL